MDVPEEDIREFEQAHADLAWVTDKARRLRNLQAKRAEHGAILQAEIDRLAQPPSGFGIFIAIPSLIFWRHFRALVDTFVVEMEQQAIKLVDFAHGDRK